MASTHCCECSKNRGEPCPHRVGRLLCREHGQAEVPIEAQALTPDLLAIPGTLDQRAPGPVVAPETPAQAIVPAGALPDCSFCGAPQEAPGGLLFGPPDAEGRCQKLHACLDCWPEVLPR